MTLPVGQLAVRPYERSSATYPSTPRSAETLRATTPSSPLSPPSPPSPSPLPPNHHPSTARERGGVHARSSFLLHLKRNSAADLLDSVEWVTDTFSGLRTQLRDRDAELALRRDYVAYLERVVEERDAAIRRLEGQARRDARTIARHRNGLDIAWHAMMPREAQRHWDYGTEVRQPGQPGGHQNGQGTQSTGQQAAHRDPVGRAL